MRNKFSKITTVVSIALAITFTFGCLGNNDDDEIDSLQNTGISSSSEIPLNLSSSSQETELNRCNGEEYDPETHYCQEEMICRTYLPCNLENPCPADCYRKIILPINKSSSSNVEVSSSSEAQVCNNISIIMCELPPCYSCNGEEYDPRTHFCYYRDYTNNCNPSTNCISDPIEMLVERCGCEEYDPNTHYCENGKVLQGMRHCTSDENPTNPNSCSYGRYPKCNGEIYNQITHYCYVNECGVDPNCPECAVCYREEKVKPRFESYDPCDWNPDCNDIIPLEEN